jgi:hypothetical protein
MSNDDRKALAENLRIRIRALESQRDGIQAQIDSFGVELRKILQPVLLPIPGIPREGSSDVE